MGALECDFRVESVLLKARHSVSLIQEDVTQENHRIIE